jgi:hypothetical protein
MLPAPRIIAIDDEPEHLRGLADGLNKQGAACLQIHFTGEDSEIRACPYVRVIFADLHLSEGGAGHGHERDFAVIGGLIEGKIVPTGPYLIVLWTRFPNQAAELKNFLDVRLSGVPKPFAVVSLDKNAHLGTDGKVVDVDKLVAAIADVVRSEPHIAALLNWEERALGAAADTIAAILEISLTAPGAETASQRLRRIVYHLAAAGVGSQHVFEDRFHAVNEALIPILADRIGALKSIADQNAIWSAAILEGDAALELTGLEAARLNRMSHIADGSGITGSARGAVIALPPSMSGDKFAGIFGMSPIGAADKQFGCNGFVEGDPRFKWILVQSQAACDYAQRQPGPLPFLLALEMPEDCVKKGVPAAVWTSPGIAFNGNIRVLRSNSRFQTSMPDAAASGIPCIYRIRAELHNALVYHLHGYGARPGHILFREERAKGAPAATAEPAPPRTAKPPPKAPKAKR